MRCVPEGANFFKIWIPLTLARQILEPVAKAGVIQASASRLSKNNNNKRTTTKFLHVTKHTFNPG